MLHAQRKSAMLYLAKFRQYTGSGLRSPSLGRAKTNIQSY
jgi:hypothetical protein